MQSRWPDRRRRLTKMWRVIQTATQMSTKRTHVTRGAGRGGTSKTPGCNHSAARRKLVCNHSAARRKPVRNHSATGRNKGFSGGEETWAQAALRHTGNVASGAFRGIRHLPSTDAMLWVEGKTRRLSGKVASGLHDMLLSTDGKTKKMVREYDSALASFLDVQTWLETHSPDSLRGKLAQPNGRQLLVRMRPEDIEAPHSHAATPKRGNGVLDVDALVKSLAPPPPEAVRLEKAARLEKATQPKAATAPLRRSTRNR